MENKNERSKNIIIVILIIMIIGLAGFICYDQFVVKKESEKPASTIEKKEEEEPKNTTDSINRSTTSDNDSSTIKTLDLTKSLNTTGVTYSNASEKEGNYGLSVSINSDKKGGTLSIDWKKFCSIAGETVCSTTTEKYQIIGFTKNVVSTFIGALGQDVKGITLFFLMDDGTVDYMPMFSSIYEVNYKYDNSTDTTPHFESSGSIKGVSNVIKLYNAQASNGTEWSTIIGAKADGSFYDLGNIISK